MITSKEIRAKTGQSMQTLIRWHQAGIIPKPMVGTAPSGRGKVAYWPDWVLDRCVRLVELQKQGHSLTSAVRELERVRVASMFEEIRKSNPSLADTMVDVSGMKVPAGNLFAVLVAKELELVLHPDLSRPLTLLLIEQKALDVTYHFRNTGVNPVLLFDGRGAEIMADFLVSHRLSSECAVRKPYVVFPLLGALQKMLRAGGGDFVIEPQTWPAPKIHAKQGNDIIEADIRFLGASNYEVVRETVRKLDSATR